MRAPLPQLNNRQYKRRPGGNQSRRLLGLQKGVVGDLEAELPQSMTNLCLMNGERSMVCRLMILMRRVSYFPCII